MPWSQPGFAFCYLQYRPRMKTAPDTKGHMILGQEHLVHMFQGWSCCLCGSASEERWVRPGAGTVHRDWEWDFAVGGGLVPAQGWKPSRSSFLLFCQRKTPSSSGEMQMSIIQCRALSEQQHNWLKAIPVTASGRYLGWVDGWPDLVWKSHCVSATVLCLAVIKSNLIKYFFTLFFC